MGRMILLMSAVVLLCVTASIQANSRELPQHEATVFHLANLQVPAGGAGSALVVSDPEMLDGEQLSEFCLFLNTDVGIQSRLKAYSDNPKDPEPAILRRRKRDGKQYAIWHEWAVRNRKLKVPSSGDDQGTTIDGNHAARPAPE